MIYMEDMKLRREWRCPGGDPEWDSLDVSPIVYGLLQECAAHGLTVRETLDVIKLTENIVQSRAQGTNISLAMNSECKHPFYRLAEYERQEEKEERNDDN